MVIIHPLKEALLSSVLRLLVTRKFLMEIYRNLMETIKIHYMMETLTDFFFYLFIFFSFSFFFPNGSPPNIPKGTLTIRNQKCVIRESLITTKSLHTPQNTLQMKDIQNLDLYCCLKHFWSSSFVWSDVRTEWHQTVCWGRKWFWVQDGCHYCFQLCDVILSLVVVQSQNPLSWDYLRYCTTRHDLTCGLHKANCAL